MSHTEIHPDTHIILVAEDSKVVYTALKSTIEEQLDFEVVILKSFDEAQSFLDSNERPIFVAVLDLHMPGSRDGEIVDMFCERKIPSIVYTSDFTEETRKRMQSKDIIDYLVKDSKTVDNLIEYLANLYRNTRIHVLLVEDSGSYRLWLRHLLEKQQFNVLEAHDGEEAWKMLLSFEEIDLVVVDYALPGMDGIELTQAIRNKYSKQEVIVLGLSSVSDPMLTARFIKSGANDFLSKPIQVEELFCRVNHNVEMLETMRALRKSDQLKNLFMGMAVHDLRSPINGINGFTAMLLDGTYGSLTDEQHEIIQFVHDANKNMGMLVHDLLDISIIESGKLTLGKQKNDIEKLIEHRLRIHGHTAKNKGIQLMPFFEEVQPFYFDENRIGQVLDNLLTNALKFSPLNGIVKVFVSEKDGKVKVCIKDMGKGIPPGEEELLFKSFSKTSVEPTGGESGTGLGLPIVKKIVEAHGGKVWVESDYPNGATFCFTLPVR